MAGEFTDYLEADDWKNAAAIVGLIRFFDYAQIPYNREEIELAEEIYDHDSEYDEGLDLMHLISRRKSWMRLLRITLLKNCIIVRRSRYCIRQNGRKRKLTLLTVS